MTLWSRIVRDSDLGLVAFIFVAGLIPLLADAWHGRPPGGEATLGALMSAAAAWALLTRLRAHARAWNISRRLLRKSRPHPLGLAEASRS